MQSNKIDEGMSGARYGKENIIKEGIEMSNNEITESLLEKIFDILPS